jgi:hypothetical protein
MLAAVAERRCFPFQRRGARLVPRTCRASSRFSPEPDRTRNHQALSEHRDAVAVRSKQRSRRAIGMVPSLEEVVLSKCNEDPNVDRKLKALRKSGTPPSAEDNEKIKQALQDTEVFFECRKTVLSDMQTATFERENDEFLKEKCNQFPQLTPSEFSRLIPTPKHLESKLEMVSEYRIGGTICCPGS